VAGSDGRAQLAWDGERRLFRLAQRAASIPARVLREPNLLPEVWGKTKARFVDRGHRRRVGDYERMGTSPAAAVSALLDVEETTVEDLMGSPACLELLARLERYRPPLHTLPMGGPAFLELIYSLVRLLRPVSVVETGVAHGYGSAAVLRALADSGRGHLYSVDLPAFRPDVEPYTGGAVVWAGVPTTEWSLLRGSDRRVLPALLERVGPVSLCLYDSDKSYEGMSRSLAVMWRSLLPGGVIAVDDVEAHDAFLDFVGAREVRWSVVPKPVQEPLYSRPAFVGLARREGRS
jgi:predicted O-methyltransferase YrrM